METKKGQSVEVELPFELLSVRTGINYNQISNSGISGFELSFESMQSENFEVELESVSFVYITDWQKIMETRKCNRFYAVGFYSNDQHVNDRWTI